jgi:glycosyltransferase involved in cell wall biosynthesis
VKVVYFGTYRQEYSRNKIMIAALKQAGVTVDTCHVRLWHGIQDRVAVTTGGWANPRFWWRVLQAYLRLIGKFRQAGDFDVLIVGYPGQFDVFLARILAGLRGVPLVWDVFMSIYLIALERRLDQKSPFTIRLLRWVEARALRRPDLLIQDTARYVAWFEETYGISPEQFRLVPTGADDRIFSPLPSPPEGDPERFEMLYYGTFIPNHGVMTILQAARHLRDDWQVRFTFIGDGPDKAAAEDFAQEHALDNVRFLGWMDQELLLEHIARSDVCLGAFGHTPQSLMTVQNKIYECMAMGRPVITGDSPAVRDGLPSDSIITCSRQEPESLANAIRSLKEDPDRMESVARKAREVFEVRFSLESLGRQMASHLKELLQESQRPRRGQESENPDA